LEQKSERVQKLVTTILAKLMRQDEKLNIETASFLMSYFVLNSSNLALSAIEYQNNQIQLPSFCDLTNMILNCSHQTIILKVILKFRLTFLK